MRSTDKKSKLGAGWKVNAGCRDCLLAGTGMVVRVTGCWVGENTDARRDNNNGNGASEVGGIAG